MKQKYVYIAFVAIILFISAFVYYRYNILTEKIHPRRSSIVESIYALGTVTPFSTYQVRTGVTLYVNKIFVKEGDRIKKNDLLIKLDENLYRSPIDGTVTHVAYMEGEIVVPQSNILSVTNLENLYLEVSLEQQSVLRVKKDQTIVASFESLRHEKFNGRVKSIFSREGQFIVHIDLEKWPEGVLPGMTADIAILIGTKNNALLIPINAIVGGKVKRRRNGRLEKVQVKLGAIADGWGEVVEGDFTESDELILGRK